MDLEQLHRFLVLTEDLNLSRAAERLFQTQPTLSRQMAALERELRVELFHRSRRGLELTPAGELLKRRAGAILTHARILQEELRWAQAKQAQARPLRLASLTLGGAALNRRLEAFRQKHPEVEVMVSFQEPNDALKQLEYRYCDVAYVTSIAWEGLPRREEYLALQLEIARPCALAAPGHPLEGRKQIELAELAKWPLVTANDESSFEHLRQMFRARGLSAGSLLRVENLATLRHQIRNLGAVGILLENLAEDVLDRSARLKIIGLEDEVALCLVCRKDGDRQALRLLDREI